MTRNESSALACAAVSYHYKVQILLYRNWRMQCHVTLRTWRVPR